MSTWCLAVEGAIWPERCCCLHLQTWSKHTYKRHACGVLWRQIKGLCFKVVGMSGIRTAWDVASIAGARKRHVLEQWLHPLHACLNGSCRHLGHDMEHLSSSKRQRRDWSFPCRKACCLYAHPQFSHGVYFLPLGPRVRQRAYCAAESLVVCCVSSYSFIHSVLSSFFHSCWCWPSTYAAWIA